MTESETTGRTDPQIIAMLDDCASLPVCNAIILDHGLAQLVCQRKRSSVLHAVATH